ncbi:MAG: hypothetical protein DRJ42_25260, partial [Deltaproteobacteria bacterium]
MVGLIQTRREAVRERAEVEHLRTSRPCLAHLARLAHLALLLLALLLVASCDACKDDAPVIRTVTLTAPQEPPPAEAPPAEPLSPWGERPSWAVEPSDPSPDPLPRFGGVWIRRHVEMEIEEVIDNEEQWA